MAVPRLEAYFAKSGKEEAKEYKLIYKIVELEAAQLPRSRADVDFAIVNGNYAMSSGMKLIEVLFQEPSFAYVNWAAVKTADKDSQWLKDVTEAYNSDEFKTYAHKRFEGYKYPAAWGEDAAVGAKAEAASRGDRARAQNLAQRWADSLESAERALALNPVQPGVRMLRGVALVHLGRLSEAEADLQQVLRQNPSDDKA